ncbi:MAG: hypothetical protein AAF218_05935 [Pseudomonadota bacterium]
MGFFVATSPRLVFLPVILPVIAVAIGLCSAALADSAAFRADPLPRSHLILAPGSDLPITGHAAPGAAVEGRLRPEDPWRVIATADAAGTWAGSLGPLRIQDGFVSPQVRSGQGVETLTPVAAGQIVTIWGQSEFHRAVLPQHAALEHAAEVLDPSALQVTFSLSAADDYGASSAMVHHRVTPQMPVSAHMVHLSNLLSTAAPGVPWHIVFHTRAGTGFQQLLSDADTGRTWGDDVALATFAFPLGQRPAFNWMSWYASDAGLAERYGPVLYAALTGTDVSGARLERGDVPALGGFPMDHFLTDLYGADVPWVIAGPHRFELPNLSAQIAANRASVDRVIAQADTGGRILRGLEPLTYLNGNPGWGGDYSHPDTTGRPGDGMARLVNLMGQSILRHSGYSTWDIPQIDQAALSADGDTLTAWSSAGPLTTTRMVRQAQDAGPVAGFRINDAPAPLARIENGRAVIRYAANGDPFPPGSRVTFGAGGIGAQDLNAEVRGIEIWQDYPIVDLGQPMLEGIPVKAQSQVLDIIPPAQDVTDPAPRGNILPPPVALLRPGAQGWVSDDPSWRLSRGTATASPTTRKALYTRFPITGTIPATTLSFVATQTGSDPEYVRVRIIALGGQHQTILETDIRLQPNHRQRVAVPAVPGDKRYLYIALIRRGAPTGDITLGSFALTAR